MTNQQIFEAIEHGEVLYDLLFASGSSALQARLERSVILKCANGLMATDNNFRAACLLRAREIARMPVNQGYAHPQRTAAAAYAFLLFNSDSIEGLNLIREMTVQNRQDWLEVTELVREYAWRRPALEVQKVQLAPISGDIKVEIYQHDVSTEAVQACVSDMFNVFATSADLDCNRDNTDFVTRRSYALAA